MGADLNVAFLPLADTKKKGRRESFIDLMKRVPKDHLRELFSFESDEKLIKAFIGYFDQVDGLARMRDTVVIRPYEDKPPLLITGGLSWGDDPTESYAPLSALVQVMGLYELFERWAAEDRKEVKPCRPSG